MAGFCFWFFFFWIYNLDNICAHVAERSTISRSGEMVLIQSTEARKTKIERQNLMEIVDCENCKFRPWNMHQMTTAKGKKNKQFIIELIWNLEVHSTWMKTFFFLFFFLLNEAKGQNDFGTRVKWLGVLKSQLLVILLSRSATSEQAKWQSTILFHIISFRLHLLPLLHSHSTTWLRTFPIAAEDTLFLSALFCVCLCSVQCSLPVHFKWRCRVSTRTRMSLWSCIFFCTL